MSPVVPLGYVDQLEIHRESPHDPLKLARVQAFDPLPETLVEPSVIAEAQLLAQEPYIFHGVEKVSTLLLYENLAEHPSEEVDVTSQRHVLRLEADPRREIRVPRSRCFCGSLADVHAH